MKALVFVVCLVLSLPNLIAGLALVVLDRTFSTRNPIDIVLQFLDSVAWGIPLTAGVLLVLLLAGIITESRPYSALCALLLNLAALGLVVFRIRPPKDLWEAVFFAPVLIAMAGFGWIATELAAAVREMTKR